MATMENVRQTETCYECISNETSEYFFLTKMPKITAIRIRTKSTSRLVKLRCMSQYLYFTRNYHKCTILHVFFKMYSVISFFRIGSKPSTMYHVPCKETHACRRCRIFLICITFITNGVFGIILAFALILLFRSRQPPAELCVLQEGHLLHALGPAVAARLLEDPLQHELGGGGRRRR